MLPKSISIPTKYICTRNDIHLFVNTYVFLFLLCYTGTNSITRWNTSSIADYGQWSKQEYEEDTNVTLELNIQNVRGGHLTSILFILIERRTNSVGCKAITTVAIEETNFLYLRKRTIHIAGSNCECISYLHKVVTDCVGDLVGVREDRSLFGGNGGEFINDFGYK